MDVLSGGWREDRVSLSARLQIREGLGDGERGEVLLEMSQFPWGS